MFQIYRFMYIDFHFKIFVAFKNEYFCFIFYLLFLEDQGGTESFFQLHPGLFGIFTKWVRESINGFTMDVSIKGNLTKYIYISL